MGSINLSVEDLIAQLSAAISEKNNQLEEIDKQIEDKKSEYEAITDKLISIRKDQLVIEGNHKKAENDLKAIQLEFEKTKADHEESLRELVDLKDEVIREAEEASSSIEQEREEFNSWVESKLKGLGVDTNDPLFESQLAQQLKILRLTVEISSVSRQKEELQRGIEDGRLLISDEALRKLVEEKYRRTVVEYKRKIEDLESKLEILNRKLKETTDLLEYHKDESARAKRDALELATRQPAEIKALISEYKKLSSLVNKDKVTNKELKDLVQASFQNISIKEDRIQTLEWMNKKLQSQCDEQNKKIKTLTSELDSLRSPDKVSTETATSLLQQLESLIGRVDSLNDKYT